MTCSLCFPSSMTNRCLGRHQNGAQQPRRSSAPTVAITSMSGAMEGMRACAVEDMKSPAITKLVSVQTSLPMTVCFFIRHSQPRKNTYSSTDDEMEIFEHPSDEIDDEAGSPSRVEASDSSIGKCHIPGALPQGLIVQFEAESNADLLPGTIKIEYHPHSKKAPRILTPEEFKMLSTSDNDPLKMPLDKEPWRPFRSREDFEFAEIAHSASLSREQVDALVKLIKRCEKNPGALTFEGVQDVVRSLSGLCLLTHWRH